MKFYIKNKGGIHAEAWIEDFSDTEMEWVVVSESKLIITGDKCLIDEIITKPQYRNMGYATHVINELKVRFKEIEPIGILSESQGFWDKFGLKDGLGQEA